MTEEPKLYPCFRYLFKGGHLSQDTGKETFNSMDLEAHEHAVMLIDGEIERLTRTIRQLQFRRTQHLGRIKYFRGLTTLARRILPEILAGIIEECVRDGWTRTPLTASHVCPEWRRAVKIPTIWSHIYVNCDSKDPCGRTRFWLQNAQTSQLNISVNVTNDASRIPSIMELLLTRAAQWQTLTITSSHLCHANYILESCTRPLTELRTLTISVSEEFDDIANPPDLKIMDVSGYSPHLRRLCIDRNIVPTSMAVSPRITNLAISLPSFHIPTKLSVDSVLTLLDALPVLQELSISYQYQQAREFEPARDENRSVTLPDLNTLILTGSSTLFRILPHLSTPSLSNLHLRSSVGSLGYPDPEIGSNFRKYVEATTPPLKTLDLHDIDLSPTNFAMCFGRLTQLRDLHLHESDISDSIIGLLGHPEGFCPHLVRLDLRWCGQMTGGALVGLVHNRLNYSLNLDHRAIQRANTHPITHMTVINCSFVKDEDLLEISESTVCRVMFQAGDYCRPYGCCQNERYRKRLYQHGLLREGGILRPVEAK